MTGFHAAVRNPSSLQSKGWVLLCSNMLATPLTALDGRCVVGGIYRFTRCHLPAAPPGFVNLQIFKHNNIKVRTSVSTGATALFINQQTSSTT